MFSWDARRPRFKLELMPRVVWLSTAFTPPVFASWLQASMRNEMFHGTMSHLALLKQSLALDIATLPFYLQTMPPRRSIFCERGFATKTLSEIKRNAVVHCLVGPDES